MTLSKQMFEDHGSCSAQEVQWVQAHFDVTHLLCDRKTLSAQVVNRPLVYENETYLVYTLNPLKLIKSP
jgi:hypothetical protein